MVSLLSQQTNGGVQVVKGIPVPAQATYDATGSQLREHGRGASEIETRAFGVGSCSWAVQLIGSKHEGCLNELATPGGIDLTSGPTEAAGAQTESAVGF